MISKSPAVSSVSLFSHNISKSALNRPTLSEDGDAQPLPNGGWWSHHTPLAHREETEGSSGDARGAAAEAVAQDAVVAVAEAAAGAYLVVMRSAELSSAVPRGPLPAWMRSTRAMERFRNEVALAQVGASPFECFLPLDWVHTGPSDRRTMRWRGETRGHRFGRVASGASRRRPPVSPPRLCTAAFQVQGDASSIRPHIS